MSRLITGDTYTKMVEDVQHCTDIRAFKGFLHALIDELYLGVGNEFSQENKEGFIDDLKTCLDITMDWETTNFWSNDTVLRDHFLDAIMKGE